MYDNILISPHLDDAVFSCWKTINDSQNSLIINVFAGIPKQGTRTLWDRICGEKNSMKMVNARRQENELALDKTKATNIYLDFLDRQYRTKININNQVKKNMTQYLNKKSRILFPIALSSNYRHPDHLILRKIGLKLLEENYNINFYPDVPYMGLPKNINNTHVDQLINRIQGKLNLSVGIKVLKLSEEERQAKHTAALKYSSQYQMTNIVSLGRLAKLTKANYELLFIPK